MSLSEGLSLYKMCGKNGFGICNTSVDSVCMKRKHTSICGGNLYRGIVRQVNISMPDAQFGLDRRICWNTDREFPALGLFFQCSPLYTFPEHSLLGATHP